MVETINGGPTKRFFVSMLTKDIELSDAILDLVDNCVDGAMRSERGNLDAFEVFKGYHAKLTINGDVFEIDDNCGGIPADYVDDAFSLGRPNIEKDNDLPTIGMFGIGMKRAIFKMGNSSTVFSNSKDGLFTVEYTADWLDPDNQEWELPIEKANYDANQQTGVRVSVRSLKHEIANNFGSDGYLNRLKVKISEHFGYIMQRGFQVFVNGELLEPTTVPVFQVDGDDFQGKAIRPFDFSAEVDGVQVKVTVGFFRRLVLDNEIDEEAISPDRENRAGISVVCNDRVILLQDKTMVTGWGDGGVPRFHPQFRAIAGLVHLSSNDAELLPLATTKRGLDAGSKVYLTARQQCIEGIKVFTAFTNKWKGSERETAQYFEQALKTDARVGVSLAERAGKAVRTIPNSKRYKPTLPTPDEIEPKSRISFVRPNADIQALSEFFFESSDAKPRTVGEEAFDRWLSEAKK